MKKCSSNNIYTYVDKKVTLTSNETKVEEVEDSKGQDLGFRNLHLTIGNGKGIYLFTISEKYFGLNIIKHNYSSYNENIVH